MNPKCFKCKKKKCSTIDKLCPVLKAELKRERNKAFYTPDMDIEEETE